jgi:hypothetical protein
MIRLTTSIFVKKTRLHHKKHSIKVGYYLHLGFEHYAVDLAFAMTAWKCQGGTVPYVIVLLVHNPNSPPLSSNL